MGERDEHGLELARRNVDPAFEQVAEKCAVAIRVGPLRVVEVAHGLVGHEQRRHRADTLDAAVRRKPALEPGTAPLELFVHGRIAEAPEHREPCRGGERVSRQGSGLVDVADSVPGDP